VVSRFVRTVHDEPEPRVMRRVHDARLIGA
jgi:hypothetical protein